MYLAALELRCLSSTALAAVTVTSAEEERSAAVDGNCAGLPGFHLCHTQVNILALFPGFGSLN